jgi:hypothetical protein
MELQALDEITQIGADIPPEARYYWTRRKK